MLLSLCFTVKLLCGQNSDYKEKICEVLNRVFPGAGVVALHNRNQAIDLRF